MNLTNTNFLLKKISKRFINFLFLGCITVFIIGFLVNCGGASIDCSNGTIKETVLELSKEYLEKKYVTSDFKLKISDIETISNDGNSCDCIAILHVIVDDESLPMPITYDASKTGKSDEIYVSVDEFDL
jgi:hypothetical protein